MPRPLIRLVITDIDGTLLTPDHRLSSQTLSAAADLAVSGITLCLASSRHPGGIYPLAEQLGLSTPFAACNGSLILTTDKEVHYGSLLGAELVAEIHALTKNAHLLLFDAEHWWAPLLDELVKKEARNMDYPARVDGYLQRLTQPVNKLMLLGKPTAIDAAEAALIAYLGEALTIARPGNPHYLDITAKGVDKGTAVNWLAGHFAVPLNEVAVLGDGHNDIRMFEEVNVAGGLSIAMGHAKGAVQAAAQQLTASNGEEGWATAINHFILGKD